jgi:hypothetical protein
MFVQVITGKVSDAEGFKASIDRWVSELSPQASGWLGSTGGVTEDGRFVALARFASEEDAQNNSDRPEQGEWWAEVEKSLDGEAAFANSTDVTVDQVGDPDQAGFVQVMTGRTTDPERARELMNTDQPDWADFRPDILGSVSIGHEGGNWTMAIYFTSEEAAREGEKKEPPPEMAEVMAEMDSLSDGPPTYYDLKDPWLHSPS